MTTADPPALVAPLAPGLSAARPPRLALWVTGLALLALACLGVFTPAQHQTPLLNRLIVLAWLLSLVCFSYSVLQLAEWRVGSSRVDLQACKLEYSIVSPK